MSICNVMEDFQRDVSYRMQKQEDGTVLLTGTIKDIFHDIEVQVVVDIETLVISSASLEFHKSPSADCCNVKQRMGLLVGFTIGKGLNRKLMEALGGVEGCGNIRNLLLAMLPLAMNLKACNGIQGERDVLDNIHEKLHGTCAGYANPVAKG